MSADRDSPIVATLLIFLGFTLLIMGVIFSFIGSLPLQRIEGGGIILIGPIPLIITGSGEAALSILIVLFIIMLLSIIIFLIVVKKMLGGQD